MNTVTDKSIPFQQLLGTSPETEEETLDLVRYWRAITRNKWRILALALSVGVLAVLVANSLTPVYRATTVMMIELGKQKLVSIEDVYSQLAGNSREYFQTQAEILKSRDLAEKLVRKMNLAQHAQFDPNKSAPPIWAAWLPEGLIGEPAQPPTPAGLEQRAISSVLRGLTVQPVRNSQLIRLSFDSPDRELASKVPNALAETFIESDLEARMSMTQKATSWLTGQSGDLRRKLAESEQALQAYRERERIIDSKGLSQGGSTKQLEDLQKAVADARARSAEAENLYNQVNAVLQGKSKEPLETLPAMQKNPLVLRLKEQESDAEKRMNEAGKRYGAEHPRFIAAESELKTARENLRRQIASAGQTVNREFEVAKANENAAERSLSASRQEMQNLNRKEFQLASLEREVATNRQLYEMFVQRFKETNISGEMQSAIARVIDPAIVPSTPFGPNKRLIVGMSILIALLVGCSLALLIERLDNTLKTSHEVETRLGVPSLGVLPISKVKRGSQLERVFLEDPQSSFAEAIRTIRSGVMLSAVDSPKKVVVITSSVPSEGKTTVAINLAFALSQVKKTLLIDADMRRPRVGRVLGGQSNSSLMGLAQLVAQETTLDKCIYPVVDTNLSVLPAGRVPPNPLELLATHRFTEVMAELGKMYDVIILDSPPLQLVSDSLVLSNVATEVVFVVKADDTPYPLVRVGIKRLRRINAPLVGIVLNQLDVERADKYYGEYSGRRYSGKYGKKYAYGYGYAPEKEAAKG
mgnify:CR=1 FL=1